MNRTDIVGWFVFICAKPGICVQSARFDVVCAFIDGYDQALMGAPLSGFREWLLTSSNEWTNVPWWTLVQQRHQAGTSLQADPVERDDAALLAALGRTLDEFASARESRGLTGVLVDYAESLLNSADPVARAEGERLRRS